MQVLGWDNRRTRYSRPAPVVGVPLLYIGPVCRGQWCGWVRHWEGLGSSSPKGGKMWSIREGSGWMDTEKGTAQGGLGDAREGRGAMRLNHC